MELRSLTSFPTPKYLSSFGYLRQVESEEIAPFERRRRRDLDLDDPGLLDRVADNNNKNEITESESLLVGRNFGVSTDIQTGPNGNLFVVSLTRGEILEIAKRQ